MQTTVQPGDRIRVHYATYSRDHTVIETSHQREPVEFIAGGDEVIEGLSRAVIGMRLGERKRIPVMPEHGFGLRDPRWQQTTPRIGIPERTGDGDQLTATLLGQELDVWIRTPQADEVTLDANHPLAGETLVYELEIVRIGDAELSRSVLD